MSNKIKVTDKMRETLERILAMEPFDLEMEDYTNLVDLLHDNNQHLSDLEDKVYDASNHLCGTTYCLAGKLAAEDGYPEQFRNLISNNNFFNHTEYVNEYLEFPCSLDEFIFSGHWPNDLDQAKKRAQLMLDNAGYFDFEDYSGAQLEAHGIYYDQYDFEAAQDDE